MTTFQSFYQLVATGNYNNFEGSSGKFHSKLIWKQPPSQKNIDEFIQKCTSTDDLFSLNPQSIKISIVELNLEEEEKA